VKLVTKYEVIGETFHALRQYGQLKEENKLPYKIPFPIAMDLLKKESTDLTDSRIMDFIEANVPDFRSYTEKDRQVLIERVKLYLKSKQFSAKTFEDYSLRGTPSSILIDRLGILRGIYFGSNGLLERVVEELIRE